MKNFLYSSSYYIDSEIGNGTFSTVYKVIDRRSGSKYAAKKLKYVFKNKENAINSTEVKALKLLDDHPNIIHLIDMIFDNLSGTLILILPLMDMSLYDYIRHRTRPLSEDKVKNFLYQLLCGIQHLHSNHLFHRDIKPENILIKYYKMKDYPKCVGETIQIGDLGSVNQIGKKKPYTAYISTRWYRPPECLLTAGYYGSKMDIWAVGCVFYEMLTLTPLFPGENELDQLFKIHDVVGSPSKAILSLFKNCSAEYSFPKRRPIGMHNLLPMLSDNGINVLEKTLTYHPDNRINVNRLLEHSYFQRSHIKYQRISLRNYPTDKEKLQNSYRIIRNKNFQTHKSDMKLLNLSFPIKTGCVKTPRTKSHNKNETLRWYLKQKEKLWGMSNGPKKNELIKKLRYSAHI